MTKIDDNIPLPADYNPKRPSGPNAKKHMADCLEVGQSYFVEASTEAVQFAIKKETRATGKTFTRRKVTENGVDGFRVWRVA